MPRGDRTGPTGMGPMSGRGAGFCTVFAIPGFMDTLPRRVMVRGRGRGCGMGMAWRHGWGYPAAAYPVPYVPVPQNEVEMLKDQAKYFGESLDNINKRIAELETEKK
jgi:hypothetical protein